MVVGDTVGILVGDSVMAVASVNTVKPTIVTFCSGTQAYALAKYSSVVVKLSL
jgi:hypothetical protein